LESRQEGFALKPTLAAKMLDHRLRSWRKQGYQVHLVFFWLPSTDLAVQRVLGRVQNGRHCVPEETVRRFQSVLRNFFRLDAPLVDTWRMYDNSTTRPTLIARRSVSGPVRIKQPEVWEGLAAQREA
jgi:predicted ABC-type ATPase